MGQTARLPLIRDRFIAGHSNCDLRRHLDSVSPETPIRDVVDRCPVWGSHADPAVRRIGKPNPDPTYPTYAVGDADSDNEATRVAVVTGQRSVQNQLEDWRVISTAERPAPKPEVSDVEKLLQKLVREPQSRPPAVVSPPVGTDVTLFPRWTAPMTAAASATATYPTRLDRHGMFLLWEVRSYGDALPQLE